MSQTPSIKRPLFGIVCENAKSDIRWEYAAFFVMLAFFAFLLKDLLIFETRTFTHDTIWIYGAVRYFFNSILQGVFPYWDPYDYCGQPFYYVLGTLRVFEPQSIIAAFLIKYIHPSLLTIFHWEFFSRIVIMNAGVYLCVRYTNKYVISNFFILAASLFTTTTLFSLQQCGFLTSFCWAPWAIWFLLRLKDDVTVYNAVGFGLFTGLMMTSQQAGYLLTFIQFFIIGVVITEPRWFVSCVADKRKVMALLLSIVIIFALSFQLFAVFIEKDRSAPILRMVFQSNKDEGDIYQGKPARSYVPGDMVELVRPVYNATRATKKTSSSEMQLYFGLIPFILAIAGVICSRAGHANIFRMLLGVFLLLLLGYHTLLGPLQNIFFPFLIYARSIFQPFFIFILFYFMGQGCDLAVERGIRDE